MANYSLCVRCLVLDIKYTREGEPGGGGVLDQDLRIGFTWIYVDILARYPPCSTQLQ